MTALRKVPVGGVTAAIDQGTIPTLWALRALLAGALDNQPGARDLIGLSRELRSVDDQITVLTTALLARQGGSHV